jgi:hypothetical protein
LALACVARARAREPLSWTAPAGCPRQDALRAALTHATADPDAGAGVRVLIEPPGQAWRAHIEMPTGTRQLEGESCQALADAVIVILTLAVDEQRAAVAADDDARAEPAPLVAPARPAPTLASDSAPAPLERRALRAGSPGVMLAAALLAEVGLLPAPSAGPRLSLGLSDGRWMAELAASALLPRHAALGGGAAPNADIRWFGGQALVCRASHPRLRLCAGGELGELVGKGSGVDRPATAHGTWLAFMSNAALRAPVGSLRLSWELGLGAAWAVLRPEFGFDGLGTLHRASQASGRLWLGLGWN